MNEKNSEKGKRKWPPRKLFCVSLNDRLRRLIIISPTRSEGIYTIHNFFYVQQGTHQLFGITPVATHTPGTT